MKTPFLLFLTIICLFPAIGKTADMVTGTGIDVTVTQMQTFQADQVQANTVQTQMMADIQRQQMERWKILQDMQTRIYEIQQDVISNRARTLDRMHNTMDEYIRDNASATSRDAAASARQSTQQATQKTVRPPTQGTTMPGGRCVGPCPSR